MWVGVAVWPLSQTSFSGIDKRSFFIHINDFVRVSAFFAFFSAGGEVYVRGIKREGFQTFALLVISATLKSPDR